MDNKKMMALSDDALDNISGGALTFNPDGNGTYTIYTDELLDRYDETGQLIIYKIREKRVPGYNTTSSIPFFPFFVANCQSFN